MQETVLPTPCFRHHGQTIPWLATQPATSLQGSAPICRDKTIGEPAMIAMNQDVPDPTTRQPWPISRRWGQLAGQAPHWCPVHVAQTSQIAPHDSMDSGP